MYKALLVILAIFHLAISYSQSNVTTVENGDVFPSSQDQNKQKNNKVHLSLGGPLLVGGINFERRLDYSNEKSFWVHFGLMDYQLILDGDSEQLKRFLH